MKNLLIGFFLIVTSFFAASGCQTQLSSSKGTFINRTNHDFLREAGVDEKTNPHSEEKCQVCHTAPNEVLTKENAAEAESVQKRQMRTDLVDLCVQCHKGRVESEHVVGVPTNLNREILPLDHEGKITCATTCHDVHTKDPGLVRGLVRHPVDTLCLSCHDV